MRNFNGKKKQYDYLGNLEIEKEYLNGRLKVYQGNGKLMQEIDYINGKIIKIKEYNYQGELNFEWKNFYGVKKWI